MQRSISKILLAVMILTSGNAFAEACAKGSPPLCGGDCDNRNESCMLEVKLIPPSTKCVCKKKTKSSSLDTTGESEVNDPIAEYLDQLTDESV